ncbi:MAG: putative dehydrogenase [Myxococcaceae bacterium]|nr:putative dehydrogenase [Myxococcaceae bacterium]
MSNSVNKSSPRRVALLGAGYISKFHVEAVRAVRGVELVAICDVSQGKADALARLYGVPKVYASLETMLAEEKLHAVHVLLPPQLHGPSVIRILEAGVDVLAEKPLGATSAECKQLAAKADELGRKLGVSHNFLFSPNYEQFVADYRAGRFGRIDQIDIVWNKELGQLKGTAFGGWLFARPENVLFEVGPHSFGHLAHLVGGIEELTVTPKDRVELPNGKEFFRRWEILGSKGTASIRLRFAFIDAFTQHYIQVRGSAAAATIDFEQGTYLFTEHTTQVLDFDRYAAATSLAAKSVIQASETLGRFVLSKMGLVKEGAPFQRSITRCVRAFYEGLEAGQLDERIGTQVATTAVELAERVRDAAKLGAAPAKKKKEAVAVAPPPQVASGVPETVLVLGGTGFIGQALVRKLREAGYGVRMLVRDPNNVAPELKRLGVGVARGDLADTASIEAAIGGIKQVYHLARGHGETWQDYLTTDVEPTKRLAELCLAKGVERLYYTSSIAIYYAGKSAGVITEDTPPHPGVLRTNIYPRAKVEIEKQLLEMHKTRGLGVVLFRPGIVLGPGGNPLHWGIAHWPFNSVPRLYGSGNDPLPIVLVDDCAEAMVLAQKVKGIEGESFNIVGEANITAQQYLDELERAAGIKFTRVPTSVLRYMAEDFGKWIIKTVGRDPARKLPSFADWDGRTMAARFDSTRARQKLQWQPTTDREKVIHEGIAVPASQFLA